MPFIFTFYLVADLVVIWLLAWLSLYFYLL